MMEEEKVKFIERIENITAKYFQEVKIIYRTRQQTICI